MGRFETEWLPSEANLAALMDLPGAVDRPGAPAPSTGRHHPRHGQLGEPDPWAAGGLDLERPLRLSRYHPLFVFNQFGDLERCTLRPGNVHSAEGWRSVLEPVIARYRKRGLDLYFRGDAALRSKPELVRALGGWEEIGYAIRLPARHGAAGADRAPADPARRPAAE